MRPEMPKPSEHHRKLAAFEGTFSGEEKLFPSPWGPGGVFTARVKSRFEVDGFFLVQDYVQEKDGQPTFRGHSVFGWDDRQKTYAWYWFDSMGEPPARPSRGKWEGDTLLFEQEHPMGQSRYTYRLLGNDRYSLKIENSRDGKEWATFMEGTYMRG